MKNKLHNPIKLGLFKKYTQFFHLSGVRERIYLGLFQVPCKGKTTALEFEGAMSGVESQSKILLIQVMCPHFFLFIHFLPTCRLLYFCNSLSDTRDRGNGSP